MICGITFLYLLPFHISYFLCVEKVLHHWICFEPLHWPSHLLLDTVSWLIHLQQISFSIKIIPQSFIYILWFIIIKVDVLFTNSPPGKFTDCNSSTESSLALVSNFHRFCETSVTLPITTSPISPWYRDLRGLTEISWFTLSTTPATLE